jgi:DNA-binding CsgD family transcriptional regulator
MEPFGLIDVFGAVLHRSQTGVCMFVALRDAKAGPADAETKRRLSTLLPHLSRAIQSNRSKESPTAQLSELFACLASPIVIVDSKLRISFSNASAEAMLAMHPALSAANGFLVVDDPRAREALEKALCDKGRSNKGAFAIMLESGAERCCVMHVLLLSQGGAALFVRSLSIGSESVGPAADLYGLTARERSVLLCITEVGGVPATARALGLSEGTVKGYLKSIFQKTGAERQADLVKVALALESPFRQAEDHLPT